MFIGLGPEKNTVKMYTGLGTGKTARWKVGEFSGKTYLVQHSLRIFFSLKLSEDIKIITLSYIKSLE